LQLILSFNGRKHIEKGDIFGVIMGILVYNSYNMILGNLIPLPFVAMEIRFTINPVFVSKALCYIPVYTVVSYII